MLKALPGVVQGYRPQVDWGGDTGSATIGVGGHNVKVATSGWRRRCVYILLFALLAISVMNLSLTLWILKTVDFNVDGMGNIHIFMGGLELNGTADITGKLTTSHVEGRVGQELLVSGYYNMTFDVIDDSKRTAALHIGTEQVSVGTKSFSVADTDGTKVFVANPDETRVGADSLFVTGKEGAKFKGSIQTPLINSVGAEELLLESITRTVDFSSSDETSVEARDGDISMRSQRDVNFVTSRGRIRFENPNVFLPQLIIQSESNESKPDLSGYATASYPTETQIPAPTESVPPTGPSKPQTGSNRNEVQVFQVCVCPNGKLFLVAAIFACVPDKDVCR